MALIDGLEALFAACVSVLWLIVMINTIATKVNSFLNTLTPPAIHTNYKGGLLVSQGHYTSMW